MRFNKESERNIAHTPICLSPLLSFCSALVFVAIWSDPPVTMETQTLQIKLLPAQTAEERARNIIANVVVEGHQASLVPYMDDPEHEHEHEKITLLTQLDAAPVPSPPRLRYYSPGPSTYKLLCPLCRERSDAAVMRAAGCKDASCCLSLLSCIFPIFWICCVCTWCGCNREWTTKGVYCSHCGGKLGIQSKSD